MSRKVFENSAVLIVDADKSLGVLFDYLKGYGFEVLVAHDGETVLTIAETAKPDIILLDVKIPDLDGFEVCRRLKASKTTEDIPVIFMTSLANTVDKVRGFALGAVDYVTKPIQAEEVFARVRTHLTIQRLQRNLEEKNVRLEREIAEREILIAELDAFAHTVAHDLKNPLGVTINYAQLLRGYYDKMSLEDLNQSLEMIVRNGQKMANIINELLLLASIRKEEVDLRPIDMARTVSEARSRLTFLIEEHQAELIIPDEWPVALGYGPWVEEIWANYVSNAIKYGGRPPRVELGATSRADGMIQFWVRDNGDGLSLEEQTRLFVPFSRLDQARAKGHGLGLSIVHRIVEKLSGAVSVESGGQSGEGSIFSFLLQA
ncbi:MAG TPA: hybrid sensor histidine kinase/response regulator, partial [Anaerolineae bacterium]